ncbi:MAG: hypothetical protein WBA93_03315 [Microcoleaceae cyanobacterium]
MKKLIWPGIAVCTLLVISNAFAPQISVANNSATAESRILLPFTEHLEALQTAQANIMETYDETANGIPVTAQYPNTMKVFGTGSGEGVGVLFTFKSQGNALDDAQVHIFLPSGTPSTTQLQPRITGSNGLIESNGWTLDSTKADGVSEFPYSWLEMVFNFSTDIEQSGHILIGQSNGQAVQIILLYPAEMSDTYWPAARTILDSLEFDANLLPIESSSEGD